MQQPTITPVPCRFGASMGRPEWHGEPAGPVRLFRVRLDSGGYDSGGAYWGTGSPLFCATDTRGFRVFVRALDRAAALADVTARYPGCRIRRARPERRVWWSCGSGRIELSFTVAQYRSAGHGGDCSADVDALLTHPDVAPQLAAIDPAALRDELREYGAWDADELADHVANLRRLVWLAASDLCDGVQA